MGEPQEAGAAASLGTESPGEGTGVILTPDQRVRVFISSTLGERPGLLHHAHRPGERNPAAHRQTRSPRPQGHPGPRRLKHPVPEPGSGCLLVGGFFLLYLHRRSRATIDT